MKILKIVFLFLGILLVACESEKYENVFDEAPDQRRKEYYEQLQATLTKGGNGWNMQYFTSEYSPGYNLYAAFDHSGSVTLGAKNTVTANVYKEYTSRYGFTYENGPSLIFTTYNIALQSFTDPDLSGATLADFEFVVFDLKDDTIRLRGKRTNAEVLLVRIPAGMSGEQCVLRAEETKQFLCPKGGPELIMEAEGKSYSFSNGYTSFFVIQESGVDTAITTPYIATADGFRLYKALEIDEKKLQNFQLTNNRNELVCTNPGVNAQFAALADDVPGFFLNSLGATLSNAWKMDKNNLGGVFAEAYTQIVNNCLTVYKEDFESLFLAYKSSRRNTTLSFKSGKYEGAFNFDMALKEGTANQIVFTNKNSADGNGNVYLKNIPGFDTFIRELEKDSYTISRESTLSISSLKFTQVSHPDNWFKVMLNY
ncbi:hypothetical protein FACS189451_06550 [Bacteroidia bacterium]|nr:hypothetical protein FACS189451_06550 [Bacteroidia bacterium]